MVVTKEHPSFMHTRKQKISTKRKREVRGWADNSRISFDKWQGYIQVKNGECAMTVHLLRLSILSFKRACGLLSFLLLLFVCVYFFFLLFYYFFFFGVCVCVFDGNSWFKSSCEKLCRSTCFGTEYIVVFFAKRRLF